MRPSTGFVDGAVRRIAHFGTFDVENYGDLLFPLVLERRLGLTGREIELTHVSPVGGRPVWSDCVSTISTSEAMTREFDGIIVGGGHIIHGQASDVAPYRDSGADRNLFAYADLWLGATLLASDLGIPIVWNAPGVPGPFGTATSELALWAASEADYLSVRDTRSRHFLECTGFRQEITIAPDTALEVDRLWSAGELDEARREAFASRGRSPADRAIAIHMNSRYLQEGIREIASLLDDLCLKRSATAMLLALGPCHEDDALQRQVARAMETNPLVIDRPRSLREIVACIRGSDFYVGSSLHGAITATAFDRPAIIVATEAPGGHAKFSGFIEGLATLARDAATPPPFRVDRWREALPIALADQRSDPPPTENAGDPPPRIVALDHHWLRIEEALLRPREPAGYQAGKRARREQFDSRIEETAPRPGAYRGILLDQARASAGFRESSQKNARRFRTLERLYRDLVDPEEPEPSKTR